MIVRLIKVEKKKVGGGGGGGSFFAKRNIIFSYIFKELLLWLIARKKHTKRMG